MLVPTSIDSDCAAHLGGNDQLITDTALFRPFADESLGRLVLADGRSVVCTRGSMKSVLVTGRVDEISTSFEERVEELKATLLVHRAHADSSPLVADAHGTKTHGRDVDAGKRGELTVAAELSGRRGCGYKDRHCASEPRTAERCEVVAAFSQNDEWIYTFEMAAISQYVLT